MRVGSSSVIPFTHEAIDLNHGRLIAAHDASQYKAQPQTASERIYIERSVSKVWKSIVRPSSQVFAPGWMGVGEELFPGSDCVPGYL